MPAKRSPNDAGGNGDADEVLRQLHASFAEVGATLNDETIRPAAEAIAAGGNRYRIFV